MYYEEDSPIADAVALVNKMLTVDEFADVHKIPRRTVYWNVEHNNLTSFRVKGQLLIMPAEKIRKKIRVYI